MYSIVLTKKFKKQLLRLSRSGNFDRVKLDNVLVFIANRTDLPHIYHDHELKGKLTGYREFHLSGDLIVIYEVSDLLKEVFLYEIGSHPEIFG